MPLLVLEAPVVPEKCLTPRSEQDLFFSCRLELKSIYDDDDDPRTKRRS